MRRFEVFKTIVTESTTILNIMQINLPISESLVRMFFRYLEFLLKESFHQIEAKEIVESKMSVIWWLKFQILIQIILNINFFP